MVAISKQAFETLTADAAAWIQSASQSKRAPLALGVGLFVIPLGYGLVHSLFGRLGDQNLRSLIAVFVQYRKMDFEAFMRSHRQALKHGQETGDFVSGVCNYYSIMGDMITLASGPYWHFVPMFRGLSRLQNHHRFHETLTRCLEAKPTDKILEIGCGFGEMGRQVAALSGANVTGLTMADEEIVGGNERIKAAELQDRCKMVQGNYHKMPFEAGTFDKIFGVYTLKYSADLASVFSEASRLLKKGGLFLSYEILVTDKYEPTDPQQRAWVDAISASTCMPPLHHARALRDAAKKAGLELVTEKDLCLEEGARAWYTCFTSTGIHLLLSSGVLPPIIRVAEALGIVQRSFTDWFRSMIVHPTTDFVYAGSRGIISGSVVMIWKKV